MPLWDELQKLHELEKENDDTIISEMLHRKNNIDIEATMNIIKFERENSALKFKPSKFKFSPDVSEFIKRRFERSND